MAGARALRFANLDAMPPHMRAMVERQQARPSMAAPRETKRRSKFGARPTHVDGIRFDSKREARYYAQLKLRQAAGEVVRFHRQVPLDLEGGVVYRCDFLVFYADGRVQYEDAKGVETKEFRMKRRMVRARYALEIIIV